MTARLLLLLALSLLCGAAMPPADLDRRAGFDQHLGAQLPLQVALRDGGDVMATLQARAHGRPMAIALGYLDCTHLCDTVMQSLAHALAHAGLQPGRDLEVLFLSIDPREGADAATRAVQHLTRIEPAALPARWQYLRAAPDALREIAQPLGFRYFRDERLNEYVHSAGVVVVTPQGKVSRYLFGVEYQPHTLRLAVVEASRGAVGSLTDRLVLLCCGYDPTTGRYTLLIGKVMQLLGVTFAAALFTAAAWHAWRRRA